MVKGNRNCGNSYYQGLIDGINYFMKELYHQSFETDSDMIWWNSGLWIRYKLAEKTEEIVKERIRNV